MDTRRGNQLAHAISRLESRHGIRSGPAGVEELVRDIEGGRAALLRSNPFWQWWRVVHWSGCVLVVCFDRRTRMITTVLSPEMGTDISPHRGSASHDVWTSERETSLRERVA